MAKNGRRKHEKRFGNCVSFGLRGPVPQAQQSGIAGPQRAQRINPSGILGPSFFLLLHFGFFHSPPHSTGKPLLSGFSALFLLRFPIDKLKLEMSRSDEFQRYRRMLSHINPWATLRFLDQASLISSLTIIISTHPPVPQRIKRLLTMLSSNLGWGRSSRIIPNFSTSLMKFIRETDNKSNDVAVRWYNYW